MQFDLITCNPPWIPAEYIAESSPLDNGVYDPKENFLNSALNFASITILSILYFVFRTSLISQRRDAADL
jgi:methylase of polypeptide subunit release factors